LRADSLRPMRVLHISDCYLPRLGGIEVQVRDLATRQRAAGHDVAVVTATEGDQLRSSVRADGSLVPDVIDAMDVYRIAMRIPGSFPVHPQVSKHLATVIDMFRPDVVHAHAGSISPFAYPAIRHAATNGQPVVVTVHSVWAWARLASARVDGITRWTEWGVVPSAVSEIAAAPMRRVLGTSVPITLIPNGIDIDAWRVDRVPPEQRDDQRVHVVAVMRLAPRKRVIPLARMFRAAIETAGADQLRATIVGDGPERALLDRYLDKHGLRDSIATPGRIPREQIRDIYRQADAMVAPAILESFGIAAMEARTAGVPVIARRTSGVATFIHDEVEGLLADDDNSMSRAMVRLVKYPELRERIAAHNAATLPESDWGTVLAMTEALYATAISQRA